MCTDASEASERARAYAIGLARRQSARLVAVHVQRGWAAFGVGSEVVPAEYWASQARDVLRLVEIDLRLAEACFGQSIEFRTCTGDPGGQIVAMAVELQADAVIIGAPRRRLRLGSIARSLMRSRRFPVIVVP